MKCYLVGDSIACSADTAAYLWRNGYYGHSPSQAQVDYMLLLDLYSYSVPNFHL